MEAIVLVIAQVEDREQEKKLHEDLAGFIEGLGYVGDVLLLETERWIPGAKTREEDS